jgi:hypothetical protein
MNDGYEGAGVDASGTSILALVGCLPWAIGADVASTSASIAKASLVWVRCKSRVSVLGTTAQRRVVASRYETGPSMFVSKDFASGFVDVLMKLVLDVDSQGVVPKLSFIELVVFRVLGIFLYELLELRARVYSLIDAPGINLGVKSALSDGT